MKFVWTTIVVNDMQQSLAFFHDLLGLPVAERFETPHATIVMLGEAQSAKIELLQPLGGDDDGVKRGKGVSLGFEPENMEAMLAKLREAGAAVDGPVTTGDGMVFYHTVSPDGYQIQLVQRPA